MALPSRQGCFLQNQPSYTTVAVAGKQADHIAARLVHEAVKPLVAGQTRFTLALEDTPTQRYGPSAQGAGIDYNLTPCPAGSPYVYGHIGVVLGLLGVHPAWGTIALQLLARLSTSGAIPRRGWRAAATGVIPAPRGGPGRSRFLMLVLHRPC